MADGTKIEWTDATWNPITGCQIVSEGCRNCYAMQLAGTRLAHIPSRAGLTRQNAQGKHVWAGETRFNRDMLDQPLRWKRPRRIFVCAHGDLFADSVPDAWIDQVFAIMALAPQHTFQVLTKRPERMREYMDSLWKSGRYLLWRDPRPGTGDAAHHGFHKTFEALWPHVWLGVSVEDQESADARIPLLLHTPAAVRWISAEPLLGPVDLQQLVYSTNTRACTLNALTGRFSPLPVEFDFEQAMPRTPERVPDSLPRLDWVVVGGESGTGARPMHPDWARSLRDQCEAAGVPFFFKQWGEWANLPAAGLDVWSIGDDPEISRFDARDWNVDKWSEPWRPMWSDECDDNTVQRIGKARSGRTLDGITHDAWPEVVR